MKKLIYFLIVLVIVVIVLVVLYISKPKLFRRRRISYKVSDIPHHTRKPGNQARLSLCAENTSTTAHPYATRPATNLVFG